jgi:hypothetical protein
MSAKRFLLQECSNVKGLLAQTLRYEYGVDGSRDFFEECSTRLDFIESELEGTDDDDSLGIAARGRQINELASLICRIERSSLGEYSWPFVEQLKKIATAICSEASLLGGNVPPKIYVFADGGLDAYRIYPETKRPSASKRLILTIVFPKSLKDFVLLHPILGHEVGHAVWGCPKHQGFLKTNVFSALKDAAGLFASPRTTASHVFSEAAPVEAKDSLKLLAGYGIDQNNFFSWADWEAWLEEILCDLIGLTTFGPGFVAALCELLYALDPTGVGFGPEHPPVAWRVNLVLRCATLLGYDELPIAEHALRQQLHRFWQQMATANRDDSWFDVFTDDQLRVALSATKQLLSKYEPSPYPIPKFDTLQHLLNQLHAQVPPVGFVLDNSGVPTCSAIDFRHIIYAGWVASQQDSAMQFDLLNRLCQHGIMQQGAIDLTLERVA